MAHLLNLSIGHPADADNFRVLEMDHKDVDLELAQSGIAVNELISRVKVKSAAIDGYLATVEREDSPRVVKGKLRKFVIMGAGPLVVALGTAGALRAGLVTSENAMILAGIILVGCAVIMGIAVWAALNVLLESAFNNWTRARRADAKLLATETAIQSYVVHYPETAMLLTTHLAKFHITFLQKP
ncbi:MULTISPECIES: hypothetical protein [unclassified Ensifer]|uniref:hypothetical protein n=1 Tax=unclassified Ensifer TaxID=2633371 RepID=UPI0007128C6E|nr:MULTISPECIES: hypothetical protein [unclassified Ensifer]KQX43203.1 hypothetical protein ASD49_11115 [Ensifer sp. Root1298]KQX72752.1 hypothetical protein ASD41_11615 [Ensifer sp. Root1312]KRC15718.1 hypothetical protein ASE29_11170 [Ensifer sp. Root74]KRD58993.1 hypothetical protein ASE71_09245 [Ensifer sp. Root954]